MDTPAPSSRTRLDLLLHGLRVPVRREDIAAGLAAIAADPELDDIALISVLAEAIRGRLRRAENDGAMVHAERARAEARLEEWRRERLGTLHAKARHRHEQEVVGALTLGRWVASFQQARAIRREIVALLGPTNSGKSHAAFDMLAEAHRGAYLAPLRLLAWEGTERLAERGIAASLMTGEERRIVPGARHLCATVEMADLSSEVDVAVIDEIQMLADEDRGWAWTQAVIGMPARRIVLAGAAEAEPMIRRLASLTGESITVRRFERMVPLTLLDRPVPLAKAEPGDAIVCFSRRDAFALREALIARNKPPAMVYGALGPDVRRAEAERFRSGTAPVLVATDAIGMGLNLPIRRILFAATTKYGGLGPHLIRQISGRAGRYGHYAEGFVGVLAGEDETPIRAAIEHPPPPLEGPMRVLPREQQLLDIGRRLGAPSLIRVLTVVAERFRWPASGIELGRLDDAMAMAEITAAARLPLKDALGYLGCPADLRDKRTSMQLIAWARRHAHGVEVTAPPPPPRRLDQSVAGDPGDLADAERAAKLLTAYLWLAQKWPGIYIEEEEARASQARLNAHIERSLRQGASARLRKRWAKGDFA
ncbi:helicase-related protein [Elioraea rosea]|uniref:helicase-related protein n=1 Tax=Elioraea rosea TaxID=2492390 RepID=UPI0013156095|nr:helicase-related protein [Elioraea rosea]